MDKNERTKKLVQATTWFLKNENKQLIHNIKNAVIDMVNGVPDSGFKLQNLIAEWELQKQLLQNKGVAGVLYFEKFTLIIIPIHKTKGAGQKKDPRRHTIKKK